MFENNRNMKTINILVLLCFSFLNGQNISKTDSIFNRNFKIINIELNLTQITDFEKNIEFFDKIVLDNGEILYLNKYIYDAIEFLEDITNIKAPLKKNDSSYIKPYSKYVNAITAEKWKIWYIENKENLKWSEKRQKPILKCKG